MLKQNRNKYLIIVCLVLSWALVTYALLANISHTLSNYLLIVGTALLAVAVILYALKEY